MSAAQLALAREYGFASWAKLKLEVERRDTLNSRDLSRLTMLLAEHPELATTKMEHWADRQRGGAARLHHEAPLQPRQARVATRTPRHRRHREGTIDAGAPVNGFLGTRKPR